MHKKIKYIQYFIYNVVLLAYLLLPEVNAYLDPRVLKGITVYFKSDMTHFSPVIGDSALASLMHDFRFYGSLDIGEKEGSEERAYSADKPHKFGQQEDAFFKLMYELFRSPTGTLAPQVAGQNLTNFHSVFSPQKIALLLNYTQELSQLMQPFWTQETREKGKKADNLKANHERALPKLKADLKAKFKIILLTEEEKKKKGLTASVQGILAAIENCILQEHTPNPDQKFLYPDHTTEQIILAYFCQNANTQKDVLELMFHLNENIIAADQHTEIQHRLNNLILNQKTEDNLLTQKDLEIIVRKDTYGMDDVYALTHAYLFENKVTPYFENSSLISNGPCHIYDRIQDKHIPTSYADCAETAARHLMNMMAYNAESKIFDFTHLNAHMKDHPNLYFENFLQFYARQTPDQVNDGSLNMRSWWNRVVGDLNKFTDGSKVRYLKTSGETEYELDPGIINLLHVFNKIFSLSLDPLEDTANFEDKQDWIEASLSKLLTAVNPNYYFDLDLSDLKDSPDHHDVRGEFVITIQDKNQEDLFNFNFYASPRRHSNIRQFEVLKQPTLEQLVYINRTIEYKINLLKKPISETLKGTAEDIWLSSRDQKLIAQHVRHPLYKLLNQKLEDNDSNIRFLKHFIESSPQLNPKMTPLHKAQLKQITRNVLKSLSWDDQATFENIKYALEPFLSSDQTNQNLAEVFAYDGIQKNFSSLTFKDFEEGDKKGIFTGIKYLTIRDSIQKEFTFYQNEKLRKLFIQSANRLETLIFAHKLMNLSRLSLIQANISEIKGLHHLPALEYLILTDTKNLKKLEFIQEMKNLSHLALEGSSIEEIQGIHYLPALKDLNLVQTKNFHTLDFTEKMENLSHLRLEYSNILTIQGLDHLPVLQYLSLTSTQNLKSIEFTKEIKTLSELWLDSSGIKEIKGLQHLPALERLSLKRTQKFESLEFTQAMDNLFELILEFSNIKEIRGLHYLSALKDLNLKQTKMLETLDLNHKMPNLFIIGLKSSNITKIPDLHYLPNLRYLSLEEVETIQSLKFENENKNLTLILTNSNINQHSQIQGIEYLDEDKIQW